MNIKIEKRVNRIIVAAEGKLDAANAPELEKITEPLIKENDQLIIIDLGNVESVSQAGVDSLLNLYEAAAMKAADEALKAMAVIRFTNISPEVRTLLEGTELREIISDADSDSPALSAEGKNMYEELLEKVRTGFPPPVSDPMRDAYFVQTIARGLNRIDDLKTDRPYLGERSEIDYDTARAQRLPEKMSTLEETIEQLADYVQGIVIWGHPRSQENVTPPPTTPSIVGQLYASIYNPNIIWDNYSHRVSQAEVELISMCSDLIGYDQKKAAGVSTFGGTGTVLYGAKIGLEKAIPGSFKEGLRGNSAKIICSDVGHYAKLSVLGWLGLGTDNLVSIPTDRDNSMDIALYEQKLRELLDKGERIACIIATMGTTDAFGIDNLEYIVALRDKLVEEYNLPYIPHIHADAVIGWAWAVFNDYDFDTNPMGFNPRTLRSLWDTSANISILNMADSVGFDFHKTGYGPYISSLFLCRDSKDLNLITRDKTLMPYLFQFGGYQPGLFTLETSRSGGSVLSALGTLKMFGKEGMRTILGHIVAMAELLRARLEEIPYAHLVNSYNFGPVTLFRIYPGDTDAKAEYRKEIHDSALADQLAEHNDYNKRIAAELAAQMESGSGFAVSFTSSYRYTSYGKPILALKSFIMSPFVDEETMYYLLDCIDEAKKVVDRQMRFAMHRKAKAEKKI